MGMECNGRYRSWYQSLLSYCKWSLEWDLQDVQELLCFLSKIQYPRVTAANGPLGEAAREALQQRYWPTPLIGGYLQTLIAMTVREWAVRPQYHRTVLRLEDDGIVALDWFRWRECRTRLPDAAPVLLIAHSMTGYSRQSFVTSLCAAALEQGWRPVALNYRGCGGLPLESPRTYSAIDTSDLHAAACEVRRLYPDAPLLLAGFSMGAMLVTKYLADLERGDYGAAGVRPAAAVAASSPFDIGAAWRRLSAASMLSPASWTQLVIVLRWQHYAWKHRSQLSRLKGCRADAIRRCRTMMDIDKELTCKAFSIRSVEDYYRAASSFQYIPSIRTPCLFIAATDDPFVRVLPVQECRKNPSTVLAVTDIGGHCAHLQGLWPFGRSYVDDSAVRFCKAVLSSSLDM